MLTLEELKKRQSTHQSIDWDMTPDMAYECIGVGEYLDSREGRRYTVKSKRDYSVYSRNCWARLIYLSHQENSEDRSGRGEI